MKRTKKTMTADEAAGELWRLAQAGTMIAAVSSGTDVQFDADGKIIPSEEQRSRAKRENPGLVKIADLDRYYRIYRPLAKR